MFKTRLKTVLPICCLLLLLGCKSEKQQTEKPVVQEDSRAKKMLQGVWINEIEEDVVFSINGDTIYYPDSTSIPEYFKVIRDSLLIGSPNASKYSITKQTEHLFVFKNQYGDEVRLVKSENPEDKTDTE